MTPDWLEALCRAGCWLLLSGCGVCYLLRWFPLSNPRSQQFVWGAVLLQGLLLFPVPVQIPLPVGWQPPVPRWPDLGTEPPPAVTAQPVSPERETIGAPGEDIWTDEQLSRRLDSQSEDSRSKAMTDRANTDQRRLAARTNDSTGEATIEAMNAFRSIAESVELKLSDQDLGEAQATTTIPSQPDSQPQAAVAPVVADLTNDSETVASVDPIAVQPQSMNRANLLLRIWVGGSLLLLCVAGLQYAGLLYALRRSYRARREWQEEFVMLCVELGVSTPAQLRVHSVLGPLLCWTPAGYRVVVPRALWEQLSAAERRAVLHHELCHLRRGDLWWGAVVRSIVVLHWINPLAWFSARRFEAATEAACDGLLTREAPRRGCDLARALLTVVELNQPQSRWSVAATGGNLYRRVKQLLSGPTEGDTAMRQAIWCAFIVGLCLLANIGWQFEQAAVQAVYGDDSPPVTVADAAAPPGQAAAGAAAASELASRLVVDQPVIKHFIQALRTPAGQIVLADRAALTAQEAASELDAATLWEQFVERHFVRQGNGWIAREGDQPVLDEYELTVEIAEPELAEVAELFTETAEQLGEPTDETLALLKRFLKQPAAPAYVYFHEVRSRLHPKLTDLTEQLGDQLVRRQSGEYVIRPARRSQVARRLEFVRQLGPALERFSKELSDWADDLSAVDAEHRSLVTTLQNPLYARYVLFDFLSEEDRPSDEAFESMFYWLEEATRESAQGLKFNTDSDEFRELQEAITRFETVASQLTALSDPLRDLSGRIRPEDELHIGLKALLTSDLGVMWLARNMNYSPVSAGEAAREWLERFVTRNEAGQFELAMEDPDELRNTLEEFFRSTREVRRRGRLIDEFARQLPAGKLQSALLSQYGKMELFQLLEQTAERPEVDGLAQWIEQHFDETPEGLVLKDWAGDVLAGFLQEVEEIESELGKADF